MRLFIGFDLNEVSLRFLSDLIKKLQLKAEKGRFVDPGLIHLTLEFLGDVEKEKIPELEWIIRSISWEPFELKLSELGCFKRREGDIVWIGLNESSKLINLWKELHRKLKNAGFKVEDRPYIPHITLGRRVRFFEDYDSINKTMAQPMPSFIVDKLHLYHSTSENGNLEYLKIISTEAEIL